MILAWISLAFFMLLVGTLVGRDDDPDEDDMDETFGDWNYMDYLQ